MGDAYNKLKKQFGIKMVARYEYNAKAILNGDDIEQGTIMPIKKKRNFRFVLINIKIIFSMYF